MPKKPISQIFSFKNVSSKFKRWFRKNDQYSDYNVAEFEDEYETRIIISALKHEGNLRPVDEENNGDDMNNNDWRDAIAQLTETINTGFAQVREEVAQVRTELREFKDEVRNEFKIVHGRIDKIERDIIDIKTFVGMPV